MLFTLITAQLRFNTTFSHVAVMDFTWSSTINESSMTPSFQMQWTFYVMLVTRRRVTTETVAAIAALAPKAGFGNPIIMFLISRFFIWNPLKGPSNIKKLIKYCHENSFLPLIVFSFSKKDVENNALEIQRQGGLDFTTETEKKLITEVFNNAMECLTEEDRALPQVTQVLPILKKGIGIHHGGLLPILKETIEILFSENLIKCLFATETFAMGVNMPAKTVIFTAHRKFDGKDFRPISGGEYIQMSGRAGRRGMDTKGIVILMIDDQITPAIAKQLLQGSADPLNSAFHLTYNMVLNLLRVEDINPEWLLSKSFFQFQHCNKVPHMITRLKELQLEKVISSYKIN